MKDKQELLAGIQAGLSAGVITEADLQSFVTTQPAPVVASNSQPQVVADKKDHLSAVDIMFYIAGIVFYSAILSFIVQSWNDGNAFVHIILSAGVGAGLWALAFYLLKSPEQTDVRKGLVNALLLTGSLSIITGGYIVTNELISGYDEVNFVPTAIAMLVVGGLHIAFDRLIKRDLMLLLGVLLGVATFPALLFGVLEDSGLPMDVWCVIFVISAGLLAYATRVVAKMNPDRDKIGSAFDSFAAFIGFMAMYIATYGDYSVLWFGVLILAIFGIFYLSIIAQNRHLLGSGSFFLVVTVITIAFKYFSGYGATTSLFLATVGLLASAAIASGINKKYFKQSQ